MHKTKLLLPIHSYSFCLIFLHIKTLKKSWGTDYEKRWKEEKKEKKRKEKSMLDRVFGVGSEKPLRESIQSLHISTVMFLSELKKCRPSEVRVNPWMFIIDKNSRRLNNFRHLRAQEERHRLPRLHAIHHCSMQATLIPSIRQSLCIQQQKQ